jgi:hypothetical protein
VRLQKVDLLSKIKIEKRILFLIVLTGFWSNRPNLLAEPERAAQRVRVDPGQPVRHPLLHRRGQRFRRIVQLNIFFSSALF